MSRRRSAFSLLELMLVLVIIVMMLAIAYPSLNGYIADARIKAYMPFRLCVSRIKSK